MSYTEYFSPKERAKRSAASKKGWETRRKNELAKPKKVEYTYTFNVNKNDLMCCGLNSIGYISERKDGDNVYASTFSDCKKLTETVRAKLGNNMTVLYSTYSRHTKNIEELVAAGWKNLGEFPTAHNGSSYNLTLLMLLNSAK